MLPLPRRHYHAAVSFFVFIIYLLFIFAAIMYMMAPAPFFKRRYLAGRYDMPQSYAMRR